MWARAEIRDQWLYRWMQTRSIGWTRRMARRRGKAFGYVYVGGYSKSGTTWIAQLVADALRLACPRDYALPPAFRCVVHHHWRHEPFLDRSIYVIRDGRDAMVSEFFSLIRGYAAMRARVERFGKTSWLERRLLTRSGRDARLMRRMESVFGDAFDVDDTAALLPRFVEENLRDPWSEVVELPWPRHVESWRAAGERVALVRYEEMLADGPATLRRALDALGRDDLWPDSESERDARVRAAVERFDFRRTSGREPGDEDRTSFQRKGIAGDWRNHLDRSTRERFAELAGETLVAAGYEEDGRWVSG